MFFNLVTLRCRAIFVVSRLQREHLLHPFPPSPDLSTSVTLKNTTTVYLISGYCIPSFLTPTAWLIDSTNLIFCNLFEPNTAGSCSDPNPLTSKTWSTIPSFLVTQNSLVDVSSRIEDLSDCKVGLVLVFESGFGNLLKSMGFPCSDFSFLCLW